MEKSCGYNWVKGYKFIRELSESMRSVGGEKLD